MAKRNTRSRLGAKHSKKTDDGKYSNYEFLDEEEEEDPYATDEDNDEFVPEENATNTDETSASDEDNDVSKKQNKQPKRKKNAAKTGETSALHGHCDEFTLEQEAKKQNKQPKRRKNETKMDQTTTPNTKRKKIGATKEEKIKLANIIKEEEIIHNLSHRLHSNLSALSAAWDRVAQKMGKSGE